MKSEILCLIILLGLGALPAQASTVDNLRKKRLPAFVHIMISAMVIPNLASRLFACHFIPLTYIPA